MQPLLKRSKTADAVGVMAFFKDVKVLFPDNLKETPALKAE